MGRKFVEQMITFFTAAVGVMAALTWNEAVQALFKAWFPYGDGIRERFLLAIIITLIAVILTTLFASIITEKEEKESKK